uniref:Uncharacterized protein n=1 Tax=Picea glauca TaxID=3330 RepID=A0A124GP87_PICGL|nr:hypothetical protein ABT39_MTgene1032 [Picea glauca]
MVSSFSHEQGSLLRTGASRSTKRYRYAGYYPSTGIEVRIEPTLFYDVYQTNTTIEKNKVFLL